MPLVDEIQQLNKNKLRETLIKDQLIFFLRMHVRSTLQAGFDNN